MSKYYLRPLNVAISLSDSNKKRNKTDYDGFSPSSSKKSLLNLRPLGSFPTYLCTCSVPASCTASAYSRGFTHDCRQNGMFVSPIACLWKEEEIKRKIQWEREKKRKIDRITIIQDPELTRKHVMWVICWQLKLVIMSNTLST